MKIEINLKIIFVLILFLILNNIDTYIIFLIFVLMHEIAHLIVGLLIGGKPRKMYLNPLGVYLEFYSYGKKKGIYKILFFLAGPISNLIVALILFYIDNNTYYKIIYTNFAICFFNLIPILPLDGGKVLREILKLIFDTKIANKFTLIFSKALLCIISFRIWDNDSENKEYIFPSIIGIFMVFVFYRREKI